MSKKKKIFIGIGGAVVLAVLIFFGTREKKATATEVNTQRVASGQIVQRVNATGKVQPAVEVNISANVSGEIISLGVEEGDNVEKGQFLVQLDQERYTAAVDQAESRLQSTQADLKLARSELKRIEELHEKGLASEAELESAQARMETSESNVSQARASLKQARDDMEKTRILSPISGTVTNLQKEAGEIALGSTFQADVIMTVADLSTMEVIVEVDESDVIDVALYDSVEVEVDALPDTVFSGKVTEIAHSAITRAQGTQEQVTNFEVTLTLDNPAEELRPGMSADVAIITEVKSEAVVVPIRAVTVRAPKTIEQKEQESVEDTDNPADESEETGESQSEDVPLTTQMEERRAEMDEVVFVVTEDMKVEQRKVRTGISSDTHFEIVSGLSGGEEIVVGSYQAVSRDIKDGMLVERSNGGGNGGGPDGQS
ncbi:MAG: efflux RND transporter periplasmic adaptor subunit [Candidatus Marinimicrobia bacterium]|nr:efflux RND transporter periplasmic adaptor subunit [Candidatus Neomarinimicrobiota bacterium]